ncbi:uncharacterized protein EAF02_001327 [Botrytis sinoallii]|uniref:uncharacterized protein n=1 Tax=Botrytis sinoallii TaxID=1463999 RepID=UPI0019007C80|nr:uncharacterized protein EAF02_001327 [Botrytis sinoallii]KAF7891002.1 hypothetical protein EAF02_001327 [Botrytis sinoallii]
MPIVISTICAGNRLEMGEYCNRNIDWVTLLRSFLLPFTTVGLIVVFIHSLGWIVTAIETCLEDRKKKQEAAKREHQPPLDPPNLQGAHEEIHERQGENISNDELQGEQEKGIIEGYQEFPIEMRQTNYGTITI